jgi:hypothetical protein
MIFNKSLFTPLVFRLAFVLWLHQQLNVGNDLNR